jgi:hypothetical protein
MIKIVSSAVSCIGEIWEAVDEDDLVEEITQWSLSQS